MNKKLGLRLPKMSKKSSARFSAVWLVSLAEHVCVCCQNVTSDKIVFAVGFVLECFNRDGMRVAF